MKIRKTISCLTAMLVSVSIPLSTFANSNYEVDLDNKDIRIYMDFIDEQEVTLFFDGFKLVIRDTFESEPVENNLLRTNRPFGRTVSVYDTSSFRDIWVGDIAKSAQGTSGGTSIVHTQLSIHEYSSFLDSSPWASNLTITDYSISGNGSNLVSLNTSFRFTQDNGVERNGSISMGMFPNDHSNFLISALLVFFIVLFIWGIPIIAILIIETRKKN